MVISGPMDAKHLGGVNVTSGMQPSLIDSYFKNSMMEPDEIPSHTFVATGRIEVPRRSDTIANTIRRPSLSIKRSLSRLRRKSISHTHDLDCDTETKNRGETPISRSESTRTNRTLEMQSSISRLRQKIGLDKELYSDASTSTAAVILQPQTAPDSLRRNQNQLRVMKSTSRFTFRSTTSTPEPDTHRSALEQIQPSMGQQQPIFLKRQPSITKRQPLIGGQQSAIDAVEKKPFPISTQQSTSRAPLPTRPKRADSGTAIDFKKLPANERPLGFKDILAVRSFEERMQHYQKARQYWAHADHGLMEWTQGVVKEKVNEYHL